MQKIICFKDTDMVAHIIPLDTDPNFDPAWYPEDVYYIVDDADNSINTYNLKYDRDNGTFKLIAGVDPLPEAVVEKSEAEKLREELEELKAMMASVLHNPAIIPEK